MRQHLVHALRHEGTRLLDIALNQQMVKSTRSVAVIPGGMAVLRCKIAFAPAGGSMRKHISTDRQGVRSAVMRSENYALVGLTVGLLIWLCPTGVIADELKRMAKEDDGQRIAIFNSGSTNSHGYRVYVEPSGATQQFLAPGKLRPTDADGSLTKGNIQRQLAEKLFADVKAAMPLSKFPPAHCAKSTSFGFTLTVSYRGESTPDLTCGGLNPQLEAIYNDAEAVAAALNLDKRPGALRPLPGKDSGESP